MTPTNGNGKAHIVSLSEAQEAQFTENLLRQMTRQEFQKIAVKTLDQHARALELMGKDILAGEAITEHLREVSAENTLRLNEHDGYVSQLQERIKAQQAIIDALIARLDALESDQSELAANQA